MNISAIVQLSKGNMTTRQVKDALFTLLHHSFLSYTEKSSGLVEYRLDVKRVLVVIGGFGWTCNFLKSLDPEYPDLFTEVAVMGMVPESSKYDSLSRLGLVERVTSLMVQNQTLDSDEPVAKRHHGDQQVFLRLSLSGIGDFILENAVEEYVRHKVNAHAGKIARMIWKQPVSVQDVSRAFKNSSLPVFTTKGSNSTAPPAFHYLESLFFKFPFVKRQSSLNKDRQTVIVYSFDKLSFKQHFMQQAHIAFVSRLFGLASCRITRYLQTKGPQEDKTIAQDLLMTAKEVREKLYALHSLGLVHIQEIPRTMDHAPSRTIYLWSVRADIVNVSMRERVYGAMLGCDCRGKSECLMLQSLLFCLCY